MREITIALTGNPNSGKTTIFNAITGAKQHVGNYAGVTVEKKEGSIEYKGFRMRFVDLPGTYSLSANSPEEVVARDFLVMEHPELCVQVLDASNLERNLYLGTLIMELGLPMIYALNMYDMAEKMGIVYDMDKLSKALNAPIVPCIGNKGKGMTELLDAIVAKVDQPKPAYQKITYPKELEKPIDEINAALAGPDLELSKKYPDKWMASRLLDNDPDLMKHLSDPALRQKVQRIRQEFVKDNPTPPEIMSTQAKFGFIKGVTANAVVEPDGEALSASDKADKIILHKWWGLPIFLLLMYLMFEFVFTVGQYPMDWIENGFAWLGDHISRMWPKSAESPLRDLLVDGIIGGVGGVLVFLPNIVLLFLVIAFLEGTGYMARAAFIMDKIMSRIGLPGKSFIPMLLGFGCTVPGIMATRTIENWRDRLTTMLILPLMSCGARLPIYMLIVPAFFPKHLSAWIVWLLYVIGIIFAIIGAKLLKRYVLPGETQQFIMELPPYRMPTLRSVLIQMWDRAKEYVKKAGTIILGVSIILWAMTTYPKKPHYDHDYDQQETAAHAEYDHKLDELAGKLGIPETTLRNWSENEKTWAEAQDAHWETEPEYKAAEAAYEESKEALMAGPGGDLLAQFTGAVEKTDEAEEAFEEAAGEHEEDSPEYQEAEAEKEKALAGLNLPDSLKEAVDEFRDDIKGGLHENLENISHERQSEDIAYSISGRLGHALEPIVKPLGFDWRIATALIGSFAAKEVFVAQMGIVFSVGEADEDSDSLRDKLQANYRPLQGFCMMLFCLLSLPCVATIAVTKRETFGWKWPILMAVGLTVLAYLATLVLYQAGTALGL